MGIEVKNADVVVRLVKERLDGMEQRLARALEAEKAEIDRRCRAAVDVDGQAMAPLSDAYRKYKVARGRKGVPDMQFTGAMLRAMTAEVRADGRGLVGRIFFNSVREAAKAAGNMRLRRFFGLSDAQVSRIKERLLRP